MSHPGIERKKAGFLVEEVSCSQQKLKKQTAPTRQQTSHPIPLHEPAMKIATTDRQTTAHSTPLPDLLEQSHQNEPKDHCQHSTKCELYTTI
jgi:hypothetical protein